MNQLVIGEFIAQRRREKNLTQAQLAERLGVSNKTVSKWETGKNMPDYSIIEVLCRELDITVSELMDGEASEENSVRVYDDSQVLDLIRSMQLLERQKNTLYGIILILMGIAALSMSNDFGGTNIEDFMSGVLMGISVGIMLVGAYIVGTSMRKK